jgi:hypothetical protein
MAAFFNNQTAGASKNFVSDAVSVFQDRASLRVTDVSSVIYRDVALWYAYYFLGNKSLPEPVQPGPLQAVCDLLSQRDDATFELALAEIVDANRWSFSL